MNLEKDLIKIFSRLSELYVLLLENLRAENLHMVALEMDALGEVTLAKETILDQIWQSEKNLETLLLPSLSEDKTKIKENLEKAIMVSSNPEQLKKYHGALNSLLDECRYQNKINLELAEHSMEKVEEMKANILGQKNNNAENYNSQGSRKPVTEHGGRLISKQA